MASVSCERFIAEIKKRWPGVTIQVFNCRPIRNSSRWSQHAYKNATDIFGPKHILDQVAAFSRSQGYVAHTLWWVKDHYDHVHSDFHPQGKGLPNCKGGSGDPPQSGAQPSHTHPKPQPTQTGDLNVNNLKIVRRGQDGWPVRVVQGLLVGGGIPVAIDGDFGPATEAAVKRYQDAHGLGQDGIVGPQTYGKLLAPIL